MTGLQDGAGAVVSAGDVRFMGRTESHFRTQFHENEIQFLAPVQKANPVSPMVVAGTDGDRWKLFGKHRGLSIPDKTTSLFSHFPRHACSNDEAL